MLRSTSTTAKTPNGGPNRGRDGGRRRQTHPTIPSHDRRAACRDADPELFHPVGTSGPALLQTAAAKKVCRGCPLTEGCLAWALETGESGVLGGTSDDERRAMRRKHSRSAR